MARLGRFYVTTEYFYVATEQFYVAIELAKVGIISIAIKDFYVSIELAKTEGSAAHDKAGRARAGSNNSVAPCCVTTEKAMYAKQTRLGAHDRGVRATREFSCDRFEQ